MLEIFHLSTAAYNIIQSHFNINVYAYENYKVWVSVMTLVAKYLNF